MRSTGAIAGIEGKYATLDPVTIAILAVILLALFIVVAWSLLQTSQSKTKSNGNGQGNGSPATNGSAREPEDIVQMRRTVESAMNDVSGRISTMMGNVRTYDTALAQHREGIEAAGSEADIKSIETRLLHELDQMRLLNERYRDQLTAARVTIRKQQDEIESVRQEAGEDSLTRIPNRRSFDRRFVEEVSLVERHLDPLSILLIDIDRFKEVNDNYGHLIGDRVLQGVAHVLDDARRQHDFLARYGGEEFVMLLPKTTLEQAEPVAERIRDAVEKAAFKKDGNTIHVTCSIGTSQFRPGIDNLDTFVARCDAALYAAKSKGRNRVMREEPISRREY